MNADRPLPGATGRDPYDIHRLRDWSATSLGPPSVWPAELRTIVDTVLASPLAMVVLWGPDLIQIYNEGYAQVCGPRHPGALGASTQACWPEVWEFNAPIYAAVRAGGSRSFSGQRLVIERHGQPEEAWFDLTYSPLRDAMGAVAGVLVTVVETTGQLLQQRRQEAEQQRLFSIFRETPGIVAMLRGPEHRFEFANDAYKSLIGQREVIGLTVADALPEALPQGFVALLDKVYATGQTFHAEGARINLQNDPGAAVDERFIDFVYQPVTGADGHVVGVFVQGADVTEHYRTQRLLSAQNRVLGLVAGGAPLTDTLCELVQAVEAQATTGVLGSILLLDEQDRLWHGAAPSLPQAYNEAISGLTIGPAVGSCGSAVHSKSAIYVADIETDPLWADFKDLALAHGLRACWSNPIFSGSGEVLGTFAMYYREPRAPEPADLEIVDFVTRSAGLAIERARAAEALTAFGHNQALTIKERTAERDLLATIVETTDVMVMAVALDYTILAINPANADEFERVYGVRPKVGDNMLALLADQPEHQAEVHAAWAQGLSGAEFTFVEEFGEPALDRPYYEITFRALQNERGDRIGAYQFVTNVTDRLRSQAAFGDMQEQLRQSQKLEAVGQLTGGVAHDFNNLLTVIRSAADLLKRPNLPEERRLRFTDAISDAADRAAKLTAQLLAFARRQALRPVAFDVGKDIRAVREMLGTLTGAQIAIEIDLPDEPCFVKADQSQFDTALVNMAVNARDAMGGAGRLTIRVATADAIPAVRGHHPVDMPAIAISLTDTGSGIDPDQIDRILEPFFTTKEVGSGTGLGLSQVFGFAKQSGGELLVESTLGEGSTFTLYLPRTDDPGAVSEKEPEPTEDGQGMCVLVVEDNHDVGGFVTQTLTELGFRSRWVSTAAAALAELAAAPDTHDIVFSDVVMPGMNGTELGRELRRLYPNLPFVLTSGYSHVLAQQGGHEFELLQKPYSVEDLTRVLRKAAAKRLQHRGADWGMDGDGV